MDKKPSFAESPQLTAPLLFILTVLLLEIGKYILSNGNYGDNLYFTVALIQVIAYLFPCALYYIIKHKRLATPMLIKPIRISDILFVLLAFIVLISGTIMIKYFVFLGGKTVGMTNYYSELITNGDDSLAVIVSVIILPAVCEEILFRGILLSEYRSLGGANAVIITALLFAMMHMSFEDFLLNFLAGLLLGFAASATRSILSSIVIHAGANAFALFATDTYIQNTVQKCGNFFVGFVIVCIFCAALIFMLIRLEYIYFRRAETCKDESLPPRSIEHAASVFFSPLFMVSIALFIVLTIYLR